ncbi:MAG: hypothetical protein MR291_05385 [Oscillospiraceae bacterium]|nr:hypothetical protein [Oscillospiraceae bacterium]
MKHALRKYIAPCGSALFMVVSTMAALVVLVTAMYMSVVSSGKVQYATFNQEQAYVSSTSIADIVKYGLANHKLKDLESKLLGSDFKEGDSISTNGNDFASLIEGGSKEDTELGGYTVDITRLKDEVVNKKTNKVFDIAVTVSDGGVVETTHTYVRVPEGSDPEPNNIDRFFTATGYVPNDVVAAGGTFTAKMYFDAEYTMFTKPKGFNSQALTVDTDMVAAGSVVFDHSNANPVQLSEPGEWYIGNNCYLKSQPDKFDLGGQNGQNSKASDNEHGLLVIGGDLEMSRTGQFQIGGSSTEYTDVYVLGDLYLGSCKFYGNVYVAGDLILNNNNWNETDQNGLGKFYIDGEVKVAAGVVPHMNGKNYQNHTQPGEEGIQAVIAEVKKNGTWKSIQETDDRYTYSADEIGDMLDAAIGGSIYPNWRIKTDNFLTEPNGDFKVVDIHFDLGWESPSYVYTIDNDCVIGGIYSTGNTINAATIIIDTGDKGDVRNIRLSSNCADGYSFSWCPETVEDGRLVNVLTVGEGTLLVDVPDGVRYQATNQEFFGSMGWFFLLGGKLLNKNGADYFDRADGFNLNNPDTDIIRPYGLIHTPGCGSCTYVEDTNDDGDTVWKCTNEDHYQTYSSKPSECMCSGYIDKDRVRSYASTKGIDLTYNGEEQMPDVDIYVISCSESADIQFGGDDVMNNLYFGYVYAPFMNYIDKGSGGGAKTIGGLIVSDYVISGYYRYTYCLPTVPTNKMLEEFGGDPLRPISSREWRYHGV